ncbi:MAG: Cys-tRNA(Pro) deacylase [Chloroflexi bacterium]|jgi:Cys-tRNA(Pro)/Cys-tRNA(Cys) deacylase|nr:Cys-tRNA(Pro) deacylase [Chloroflexota bacterium]
MSGRGTPAMQVLERAGVRFSLHEYDAGAPLAGGPKAPPLGYGERTAAALGIDPARIHKTLIASVDGRLVAAVVPVDRELDLKALAAVAGGRRAEMADPAAAERSSGYVVGGISPLGQKRRLPTVVDAGALAHATILVSGGRRGLQVELAPHDLVRLTDATVAAIAR